MLRKLLTLAVCTGLLTTLGCGGTKFNTAALKNMKKVAIVSLSMYQLDGAENVAIQQDMTQYAATVYANKLDKMSNWQLVPAPGLAELEAAFADLSSSPIAHQVLDELAAQNRLPGDPSNPEILRLSLTAFRNPADMEKLKQLLKQDTLDQLQEDLADMRTHRIVAKGTLNIPFDLINGSSASKRISMYGALRDITARILEDYRLRHGLDGVIFVYMPTREGRPGDIRIIVQKNRVISSLKLNPNLYVRGTGFELVYAGGSTRLDDLAPMKLGVPIFTGTKNSRGMIDNLKLSLDDPKGTMRAGYKELIDETSDDLIEDLKEELMSK